jgi:hypothetical protein
MPRTSRYGAKSIAFLLAFLLFSRGLRSQVDLPRYGVHGTLLVVGIDEHSDSKVFEYAE